MSSYSFVITPAGPSPSPSSGVGSGVPASGAVRGTLGGWDLRFDPITNDLVDDGAGAFELTTTASTAVLHQLICHYDAWWADPEIGSRLHDPDLFFADPERLIADECERALQVLVDAGRIVDVEVLAEETGVGRVNVQTSFRDAQAGQLVDFLITPSGG